MKPLTKALLYHPCSAPLALAVVLLFLLSGFCSKIIAQQSVTPYPANDLQILEPQLSVPGNVQATYAGPQGADNWSYWVVAAYVGGSSGLSQPANLTNVGPLSGSNTVAISWVRQTNATGYTVLRSPRAMQPTNGCACVVATVAGSVGTATDSGAALTNWTQPNIGGPTLLELSVNNRDYPFPRLIHTLPRGFWDRDERDFVWKMTGAGSLAQRPLTCQANHDVYICNGADCPGTLAAYYCTSTDVWTILTGGGTTVTNWTVVGVGPIVNLPAVCTVNQDVFICTGAGCKGNTQIELSIYYCTAPNVFTSFFQGIGYWFKYVIPETALTAAATTESIPLFVTDTNTSICGTQIKHSAAFTGGGLTAMTVSLGVSGEEGLYGQPFDIFQAPANNLFQTTNSQQSSVVGATATVLATFDSVGANVNAATTGSVSIWVCSVDLPGGLP